MEEEDETNLFGTSHFDLNKSVTKKGSKEQLDFTDIFN